MERIFDTNAENAIQHACSARTTKEGKDNVLWYARFESFIGNRMSICILESFWGMTLRWMDFKLLVRGYFDHSLNIISF